MADQLHGWKSIAAHFGRERSTVMRWASERALPIHRYPGGKKGGVYASIAELEAWAAEEPEATVAALTAAQSGNASSLAAVTTAATDGFNPVALVWRYWPAVSLLILVFAGALVFTLGRTFDATAKIAQLPGKPEALTLYLEARDDWARREPIALQRSIRSLLRVTEIEPDFAPAYAALADSYLLSREFGSLEDDVAFPKAMNAAQIAVRLDPALADAHRAIGFTSYWWEHDNNAASAAFRRALSLDPGSAQTRFWYGNVLSDNGQHSAGLRELDHARLLEPGSVAIRTDLAWALWASGAEATALHQLREIARANPDFAVVHECLAIIELAGGNYDQYIAETDLVAQIRRSDALRASVARLISAKANGLPALQGEMLSQALDEVRRGTRREHSWPAFVAGVSGNRRQLILILSRARARKEVWGNSGLRAKIGAKWSADRDVIDLLSDLGGENML